MYDSDEVALMGSTHAHAKPNMAAELMDQSDRCEPRIGVDTSFQKREGASNELAPVAVGSVLPRSGYRYVRGGRNMGVVS